MVVVALSLVVSADSVAAPCPNCPELPPQPHALMCPPAKSLTPAGATREEGQPSIKVGKIADAFSVSSTGEAVYSISLNVPAGRLGMEPHLSLSYNSGSGEGPFGMGFGLSGLSSITRCASNIAQDHRIRGVRYDDEDNFCLDGLRLVPVPVSNGHTVYGAPTGEYRTFPDTFRRVQAFATAGPAKGPQFFTVETKSGRTLEYGHDPMLGFNGRVMGKDGVVRAWAVTLESDRHANTIAYSYRNDREVPGNGHTITHVPQRIDYTGNSGAGTAATHAVVFDTFDYIQHANAFTGGMLTNHKPAVSRIRMLGPGDLPVRSYILSWNSGANGRARIEIVQECGGASFTDCRPPTRLTWLDQPGNGFTEVDTNIAYPTRAPGKPYTPTSATSLDVGYPLQELDPSYKWLLADVTGDGLSDLVISQASLVSSDPPKEGQPSCLNAELAAKNIVVAPFGDNDIPACAVESWNVATNLGGALTSLKNWRQTTLPVWFESRTSASFSHQAFDLVPMDVNHDGRTDILYYDTGPNGQGSAVNILTNTAPVNASAFVDGGKTDLTVGASLPDKTYSDSGVLYADMNGDGMLDAITCEEGPPFDVGGHSTGAWQLHLWDPKAKSFAASDPNDPQASYIPMDFERGCYLRNYIHVVDVDGDGKAELLIPPKGYPREESVALDWQGEYIQLPPQCVAPCEYQALQRDHQAAQRDVVKWYQYPTKLPTPDWSIGSGRMLFLDVNGDGLPDAVMANPPGWALEAHDRLVTFLNTGDGFDPVGFLSLSSPLNFVSGSSESEYLEFSATIDYDGDGQTDLLVPMRAKECSPAFDTWSCWAILKADPSGDGHLTFVPTKIPFAGANGDIGIPSLVALGKDFAPFRQALIPRVADMNGDGRQDIVIPMNGTFKLFLNEGPVNLLHAVTDGMNPLLTTDVNTPPAPGFLPNITIDYGSLVDHATTVGFGQDSPEARNDTYLPRSDIADPLTDCDYPRTCVVGPRRVVKSYQLNNGQNQPRKISMRYRNGRSHRLGRGFLGFDTVITTDEDGHSGHAELYDTETEDDTVLNQSTATTFPITTFPNAGQVATSLSWVLGLPEDPAHPSLPVARMHFVKSGTTKSFSSSSPKLLVATNANSTYFMRAQQTKSQDIEAVYLAADADKPLPDFVAYYGGGLTYAGGGIVPYFVGANNPTYKVLDISTTSTINQADPGSGAVLDASSATIGVDDIRTVSRKVDNDVATWRLGEVRNETVCSKVIALQSSRRCVATDATYDSFGDVYSETTSGGDPQVSTPLPLQATTTYTRDGFGNVTNVDAYDHVEGHQRAACVGYDSDGMFPVVFGNAAGIFSYVKYDTLYGAPIVVEDPNGLTTSWKHDTLGRTMRETGPDGPTDFTITRAPDGGPGGNWWALHARTQALMRGDGGVDLDSVGRTVRSWAAAPVGAGVTTCGDSGGCAASTTIEHDVDYDFLGRVERRSRSHVQGDAVGANVSTTYAYDNLGRVLSVATPWQATTKYSYHGNTVTVNAPGTSSTSVNDAWGRPTAIVDGLLHTTGYEYAYFGGLHIVRPPGNTPITTERDAFGRVIQETDPDRGLTNIVYDGFGERIGVTDGEHTESYDYDVLGRMVVKTDEAGQTIWHYDNPQKGLGRLSDVVNPDGITRSYTYQGLGQGGVGQVHSVQLTAGADSVTTTLDYDAFGRLATIAYPPALGSAFRVRRAYDGNGNLLSVKDDVDPSSAPYWELRQVNGAGQTTQEQMNGGSLVTTRSYSTSKSTLEHILTTVNMTTKVQDLAYTYDDRLNMTSRIDGLQLIVGAPLGEHFAHDELDRLTCSWLDTSCTAGPGVTCPCNQGVKYKENGNIDTKSDAGTYAYDPDHPHAVQFVDKQQYGYDKVGNQTTRPGLKIEYTPFDLPGKYTDDDGVETMLQYDGDQTRVRRTVKLEETLYFGDYERVTHLGTVEHRYSVRSDERVVAIVTRKSQDPMGSPGTRTYVHVDHLGSVEKVTNAAGTILERRSYDAFGAKRNPSWISKALPAMSTTIAGYTGHEDDEVLGLVNMKGRIYDPRIARFTTTDPLVSHPGFSQSWNPYSYVMNSPLKYVDPSGYGDDPLPPFSPGCTSCVGGKSTDGATTVNWVFDPGAPPAGAPRDDSQRAGNKDAGAPQADTDASASHVIGIYGKTVAGDYAKGVAGTAVDTSLMIVTFGMWSGGKVVYHIVRGAVDGGPVGAVRAYAEGLPIVGEAISLHDTYSSQADWSKATPAEIGTALGHATIPTASLGVTAVGIGSALMKGSLAKPALEGDFWSPAEVVMRQNGGTKPAYVVNPAHKPGPTLRPGKTPLPADAAEVFQRAVPDHPTYPNAWFGKNDNGQIYRYSLGNDGTAHYSGTDGVGAGIRNITQFAIDRLGEQ
jgi:RHS repeat-associated protein